MFNANAIFFLILNTFIKDSNIALSICDII